MIDVALRQIDEALPAPGYARTGDAGADLLASEPVLLPPRGGRFLVPTGVAIALPEGYAGLVLPRSGLAVKHGVTCLNTPGLIDSGYRGELRVLLVNTDPEAPYRIERGDRIAQLVIVAVEMARFLQVSVLPPSDRAEGGFGHTGR